MTTPHEDDGYKAREILERRDADGQQIYGHVRRDPVTGQWFGRRVDDHTKEDRVA